MIASVNMKREATKTTSSKMSVLYMVKIMLSEKLLSKICQRDQALWRKLKYGTKIGCSDSWEDFLDKLQRFKTWIPFARLGYTAILHPFGARSTELCMHLIFHEWRIRGEWFDMGDGRWGQLLSKFGQREKRHGVVEPPRQVNVGREEGKGFVYFAKYAWNDNEKESIIEVLHDPLMPIEDRICVQRMLATKIGSTSDLAKRGYKALYSQCFSNFEVVAVRHDTMASEEQILHDICVHYHSGVGEWIYLFSYEHNDANFDVDTILQRYDPGDIERDILG